MSWMAIVEGATGLFYWEYGMRGLYEIKDPVEHAALYQELINVTTEIKSLEPVLLSPDAPVITANSAAGTVFTKTKVGSDGTRYLFAYNYTGDSGHRRVHTRTARGQHYRLRHRREHCVGYQHDLLRRFQPYQAHIFLISNSAPPRRPFRARRRRRPPPRLRPRRPRRRQPRPILLPRLQLPLLP